MKKVIIVGGGVAGLAAAADIVSKGVHVKLFESRPYLGGRIYSFEDPVTKCSVDNGQHLFAGFYYETFKFLSLIGSIGHITRQKRLEINFLDGSGASAGFSSPRIPSPANLFFGLLRYPKFPNADLFRFVMKRRMIRNSLDGMSADEYLNLLGQSEDSKRYFFEPLVLATLNARLGRISAGIFQSMMDIITSVPASDGVLAYSTVRFSDLIAEPATDFITENGGDIYFSTSVEEVLISDGKIAGVVDSFGDSHEADQYILALPPDALDKLLPKGSVEGLEGWEYSPIVSVNIWYDRPVFDKMMVGLLDGNFHWFFDKGSYVTLLASAADDMTGLDKKDIVGKALDDVHKFFPESKSAVAVHTQVIKENKATVLITPEMYKLRPGVRTRWSNLFLAGDWIDTGLPATVESAAKSGFGVAGLVGG